MTHTTAIKLIRAHQNLTWRQFAGKMTVASENALHRRLNGSNIAMNDLVAAFDALGYQLVFQPKGKETLPEKCYPIRLSDYNIE